MSSIVLMPASESEAVSCSLSDADSYKAQILALQGDLTASKEQAEALSVEKEGLDMKVKQAAEETDVLSQKLR